MRISDWSSDVCSSDLRRQCDAAQSWHGRKISPGNEGHASPSARGRRSGGNPMSVLAYLIPISLCLGIVGLIAFLWSLKSGQYEDLDGAAERVLFDDDDRP